VTSRRLRLGTRGSALALVQARLVADALRDLGTDVVIETIETAGDRRAPDTPWGEGAFVTAIQAALAESRIDLAVHSAKDLPTDEPAGLRVAAFLPRADPTDALVLRDGRRSSLAELPTGTVVGTDSPRRTAFLLAARPGLTIRPLHGNVDTRLARLDAGEVDVLVLATAGLVRLGRDERIAARLEPGIVPPAPGQGALAVQVRGSDAAVAAAVARLDHAATRAAVQAERAILLRTGGGCRAPLGALGRVGGTGDRLELLAGYARGDGSVIAIERATGPASDPGDVVDRVLTAVATTAAAAAVAAGWPRVIVTRPEALAAATVLALVDRGLAPLPVPAIEIVPLRPPGLEEALDALAGDDVVVVTSANGARAIAAAVPRRSPGDAPSRPRWIALGPGTAAALREAGIEPVTAGARTAAELADAIELEPGTRVLAPRGDLAGDDLAHRLEARGAVVSTPVVYETREAPPASRDRLATALASSPVAGIVASGSAARGLVALAEAIGEGGRIRHLPLVAIGPATAAEARRLGLAVEGRAAAPGPGPLADAVAAIVARFGDPA
jgi:hydroxymethylbilane synthase